MLVSIAALIIGGTAVADLSALHAQNPDWPAHARFHAIWHVMHVAGAQSVALALLWLGRRGHSGGLLSTAAAVMAAYPLSFLVSLSVAPLFDASITPDVPEELMPARPLGLDGNLFSVLIVTPLLLTAWWLVRRR